MPMFTALWIVIFISATGCAAQPTVDPPPADTPPPLAQPAEPPHAGRPDSAPAPASDGRLTADASVDQVLDALDARGQNLRSLATDVKLLETDATTGDDITRTGRFMLETRPDGSARARVNFDQKIANNRKTEEKIEYLLDGQNLIDRTYRTKTQVTRQVLKPGEKINLLKLGEGPFPLPIGQKKDEVHRLFEVSKIPPTSGDPANTVHLKLVPREGTQFADKFQSIDAWVDLTDHMPHRIETVDPNGVTVRTTELSNLRINPKLDDSDFALSKINEREWNLHSETFQR